MPEDNEKKKKGPKLFKPGKDESDDGQKKKGPKLFKPGGKSPKPASAGKKQPKLFKPGKKDKPKPGKKPKLFKPDQDKPSKKPKKQPKLFKAEKKEKPKPKKKQPKLFKPEKKEKKPQKPKKQPKLFKAEKKETQKPKKKKSKSKKKQPKLFKPEKKEKKKPKKQPTKKKKPKRKKKQPAKKKKPKRKKKQPKKRKRKTPSKPKKKEKKEVSAADLLAMTEDEEEELEDEMTASDKLAAEVKRPKKKKAKRKGGRFGFISQQLYLELDVRKMWYKSMFAGFLGVFLMMIVIYIMSCFEDSTFLESADFFTAYAQGNSINEAVGIWTVAYTPLSVFGQLDAGWTESWYLHLAPILVMAFVIGWQIKNPKYAILSSIFFVMWSVIFAFICLAILPMFGVLQPNSIDAGLIASYPEVVNGWSAATQNIADATSSTFFAWATMGALQQGALLAALTIPISIIFALAHQLFGEKIE